MIKPVILSLAAATALAACSASEKQESPNLGAANSASEFCVKQGGKSEIKKDKDGGEYDKIYAKYFAKEGEKTEAAK